MIECITCGFCYYPPQDVIFDTVCPCCGELLYPNFDIEEELLFLPHHSN